MTESARWVPTLDDYVDVAGFLLGTDPATVLRLPRIDLAESALHAPFAEFGGVETDAGMVERIAAGQASQDDVVAWIKTRTSR